VEIAESNIILLCTRNFPERSVNQVFSMEKLMTDYKVDVSPSCRQTNENNREIQMK